jgi:hypothetical protein
MLIWNFIYGSSIGPICFVIICEASATRVRSKTIAVATAVQATFGIVMTVAIPYMINPDQANMRGKLGFFFGGLAGACLVWAYFRVPEFKVSVSGRCVGVISWVDANVYSGEDVRRAGHHVRKGRPDERFQEVCGRKRDFAEGRLIQFYYIQQAKLRPIRDLRNGR